MSPVAENPVAYVPATRLDGLADEQGLYEVVERVLPLALAEEGLLLTGPSVDLVVGRVEEDRDLSTVREPGLWRAAWR